MKKCPKCKKRTLNDEEAMNCLSREDGKTYICQSCGKKEIGIERKS